MFVLALSALIVSMDARVCVCVCPTVFLGVGGWKRREKLVDEAIYWHIRADDRLAI